MSETKQIVKAITQVVQNTGGLLKKKMGEGYYSFNSVSAADVRLLVREEMAKQGLTLTFHEIVNHEFITELVKTRSGAEVNQYRVNLVVKFRLHHSSGEFLDYHSLGVGVDNMDKHTGKAMTYAEKACLIQIFNIPALDDDGDYHQKTTETNSPAQQPNKAKQASTKKEKPKADMETVIKFINDNLNFATPDQKQNWQEWQKATRPNEANIRGLANKIHKQKKETES